MDYSIIKSNQPLHLPQNVCTDDNLKIQYPFSAYCEICHKIIQFHRIRLMYDHYVSNMPNPDDINAFCHYFISNYTALVKIEMVSKSVMRSIRDKRISLLAQVSELGKNLHVSLNPGVNLINLFELIHLLFLGICLMKQPINNCLHKIQTCKNFLCF